MLAFSVIALLTLGSAAVALTLRNLIHSALLLVASWAGIAAYYLWAGAEFVAFAQLLVYVGAVSMIVLFAVLLTRRSLAEAQLEPASVSRAAAALLVGGAVLGVLWGAILGSGLPAGATAARSISVKQLGLDLMVRHPAAVLITGVILTVALLGAIVVAANDREPSSDKDR